MRLWFKTLFFLLFRNISIQIIYKTNDTINIEKNICYLFLGAQYLYASEINMNFPG